MTARESAAASLGEQRVHVICECCGRRHDLERRLERPETLYLVCHGCEASLCAVFSGAG